MRKVPSLRAGVAMAVAEFNSHSTPPPPPPSAAAAAPQSPPVGCDAKRCPWWPYSSSKDFKANTALIIVVLFCALICAIAFNAAIRYVVSLHCNRRRRRRGGDAESQKPGRDGAAAEEAAEIPALTYAEGMQLAGAETECIICLSDFAVGEKIRVLDKCNHGFHLHCIQKWLTSHSSCPTCRTTCSPAPAPTPP